MTFRTRFWFGVVARGGRGLFSRDRFSPFVPSPGMRVSFDDDPQGRWEICKVSRVPPSDTWSCYLGEFEDSDRDWLEVRDEYLSRGWVLLHECVDHARAFWLRDCRGAG
jgi:hypothetical protein